MTGWKVRCIVYTMKKIISAEIAPLLKRYSFIVAAYQFGSTVRGQQGPLSDLDIAILVYERKAPSRVELCRIELLLAYEIQKCLSVPHVDLMTLNHQRVSLQHTILQTGVLLYDSDPRYRMRFVQRVIEEYLDFQPTLRLISQFHTRGRLRRCGLG